MHVCRGLDHLWLFDIIRPRLVPEQISTLPPQINRLLQQRHIDGQPVLVRLHRPLASLGVLCVFEDGEDVWSLEGDAVGVGCAIHAWYGFVAGDDVRGYAGQILGGQRDGTL